MASKKKVYSVGDDAYATLAVVALDPVRNALARGFLALLGLRNVQFVSTDMPIELVKNDPVEEKPKAKRAKKKA